MSRPYRGHTPEARAADRRERLVDAGIELVGTGGVAAMSMRAVCRQAQLSQKYFYESFADTDELLREVYRVTFERGRAVTDAAAAGATDPIARTRASVAAAAKLSRDDPRVGRILLMEPMADLKLRQFVRESIADMLFPILAPPESPELDPTMVDLHYTTVFGAVFALFLEWTEGNLGDDQEAFVEHVTKVVSSSPLFHLR